MTTREPREPGTRAVRQDFQLKIRGYRIEIGEVEAALAHLEAGGNGRLDKAPPRRPVVLGGPDRLHLQRKALGQLRLQPAGRRRVAVPHWQRTEAEFEEGCLLVRARLLVQRAEAPQHRKVGRVLAKARVGKGGHQR